MPGPQPWPQNIWWQASVFFKSPVGDSVVQPGLRTTALCKWHSQKQGKGDNNLDKPQIASVRRCDFRYNISILTSKFALFPDIAEGIAWLQFPLPSKPNPNLLTWIIQLFFKIWFLLLQPQKRAWLCTRQWRVITCQVFFSCKPL